MNGSRAQGSEVESPDTSQVVVGILADREAAPAGVAQKVAENLADHLHESVDPQISWDVRIAHRQLPAGESSNTEMIDAAREYLVQAGWDLAICLTDLPLRVGEGPLVADVSVARRAAVLSLPGFGGMLLGHRVRRVVVQIVAELVSPGSDSDAGKAQRQRRKRQVDPLPRRFERVEPDDPEIDTRFVASRGHVRMLIGVLRANRPWRLVFGLTRAMAAAVAISAFYLVSSAVWELGNQLEPVRLVVLMLGSLGALVTWLILRHNLWESPRGADLNRERRDVAMFNATTVISLVVGVGSMYAVLFALNLLAGVLILDGEVLGKYVGSALGAVTYLKIAWLTSSAAAIGGALGSGFDSPARVREAAYSLRERQRREERRQEGPEASA